MNPFPLILNPPKIINTSGRRDYWRVFQEWMMSQLSPQAPQIPATESDEQVERRLRILTKIIEWLGIKSLGKL